MDHRTYNTSSLLRTLDSFESEFGMSSHDFYARHQADDPSLSSVPGFTQHVWASMYREARTDDGRFAAEVGRTLQHA